MAHRFLCNNQMKPFIERRSIEFPVIELTFDVRLIAAAVVLQKVLAVAVPEVFFGTGFAVRGCVEVVLAHMQQTLACLLLRYFVIFEVLDYTFRLLKAG